MADKLWSGRLPEGPHPAFEAFSRSLPDDLHLFVHDLQGSIAHVHALLAAGLLEEGEASALEAALAALLAEGPERFPWEEGDEDIHSAVERILVARLGPAGEKLHTGRSRNDQVATDTHLWASQAAGDLAEAALDLARTLEGKAREAGDALTFGMTHLQRAQPLLLAHALLAHAWPLVRDARRFLAASVSALETSPLGAGALAGNGYGLDSVLSATELGFKAPYANSIDAVADRDFLLELVFAASLSMAHLSRLAEEAVLWTSQEFSRLRLPEGFVTGSSMMPQKRNPDVMELVRGRSGAVFGDLTALLVTLKGLPLAYMRDLQEDKPPAYHAASVVGASMRLLKRALEGAVFRGVDIARGDLSLATDLADALVRAGLPFRQAHRVVGGLARLAEERGGGFETITPEEFREASPLFPADPTLLLDPREAIARRSGPGGTAEEAVAVQREALDEALTKLGDALERARGRRGGR